VQSHPSLFPLAEGTPFEVAVGNCLGIDLGLALIDAEIKVPDA